MARLAIQALALGLIVGLALGLVGGLLSIDKAIASSTATFYGVAEDGIVYNTSSANYTTARGDGTTTGAVDHNDYSIKIGQENNTGTYSVWRSFLAFDTSALSNDAVVTGATLYLYGREDQTSGQSFNLTMVPGYRVACPDSALTGSDYGVLFDETQDLGRLTINNDLDVAGYNQIAWDTEAIDLMQINLSGYTRVGLRSDRDIAGTSPGTSLAQEWASFWSFEKGYGYYPKLEITYTVPDIGDPDTIMIASTKVYSDYIASGDMLVVFATSTMYETEPTVDPRDYFHLQLLDAYNGLVAQVPLTAWGFKPASIYLGPDATVPIQWEGTYSLRLVGRTDKYGAAPPSATYQLQNDDWRGEDLTRLDSWIMGAAIVFGISHEDDANYYRTAIEDEWKLNDEGSTLFLTGIHNLDAQRPSLFMTSNAELDWPESGEHDDEFESAMANNLGDTVWGYLDDIGLAAGGIDGKYIGAMMWILLGFVIVGLVAFRGLNPLAGGVIAAPLILAGNYTWTIPLALTASLIIIGLLFFWRRVWLSTA